MIASLTFALATMTNDDLAVRADTLYVRINADYWDARSGLYREKWSSEGSQPEPAFNWSVGVMLSALNARASHDPAAKARLAEYLKGMRRYWNSKGPVAGFDVLPDARGIDRYYDDNAWMVMALMDSAAVLEDEQWKLLAVQAMDFVLSGEDDSLGGGIYWRESNKASKNTCSNAPSAAAAFAVYKATGEEEYRKAGIRLTKWTLEHMLDPEDLLLWDNVSVDGKVEKTKWSYNSALTVLAVWHCEQLGIKMEYSSRSLWDAAWKRWNKGDKGIEGPGRFAHLLIDVGVKTGYLSRAELTQVAKVVSRQGGEAMRFGGVWDRPVSADRKEFELLDQASVMRTLELAVDSASDD